MGLDTWVEALMTLQIVMPVEGASALITRKTLKFPNCKRVGGRFNAVPQQALLRLDRCKGGL